MKYTLIRTFLAAIAIFFAINANSETSQTSETTSTLPKTAPVDADAFTVNSVVEYWF